MNRGGGRSWNRGQFNARPSSIQSRPAHLDGINRSFDNRAGRQFSNNNVVVNRNPRIMPNTRVYTRPIVRPKQIVRPIPVLQPVAHTNVYVNVGANYRGSYGYHCGGFYYGGGYHYYPVYYRPFRPYFGARINVLPFGYYPFYFNSFPYYFYNGLFYRQHDNYYETVEPPLGARVPDLPSGASVVKIDGQKYYEHDGTYYQKTYNERGETLYEVVGTDGVLETDKAKQSEFHEQLQDESSYLSSLPEGSKTIELDGRTYYVSPAGDYYSQIIDKDNRVYYALAGNESVSAE